MQVEGDAVHRLETLEGLGEIAHAEHHRFAEHSLAMMLRIGHWVSAECLKFRRVRVHRFDRPFGIAALNPCTAVWRVLWSLMNHPFLANRPRSRNMMMTTSSTP